MSAGSSGFSQGRCYSIMRHFIVCFTNTQTHPHLIEGLMITFISEEVAGGPSLLQFFLGCLLACSQGCPTYHISLPYESTQSERYCCFRCSFEKCFEKLHSSFDFPPPPHIHPLPLFLYALQSHPTMPAVFFYFFTLLNSTLLLRPASLKGESLES